MKKIFLMLVIFALLAMLAAVPTFAQTATVCESTPTVAAGDWLSKIAATAYGSPRAYFQIFSATNSQAIADKSFHFIDNPGEIEVGWKLCVPAAVAAPAGLAPAELQGASYKSDYGTDGVAKLVGGKFSAPAEPGTPLMNTVFLSDAIAYGTIGGTPSAVVALVENGGGSGVFTTLHLVQAKDGALTDMAQVQLGDRINLTTLAVHDDKVDVGMTTQGPDEPMCCGTERVWNTYTLNGDKLEQATTQVVGNVGQAATESAKPAPSTAPSATPSASGNLSGVVWKWTKTLYNNGSTVIPVDPNRYLIQFLADGTLDVTADCNHVGGTYKTDGNQLTITLGPSSTLVACPPDSQAPEFTRQLGNVASYLFDGDDLVLEFKLDSGTMTFAPSAPNSLAGTQWMVVNYNNSKHAVVTLLDGSTITLNFGTDGQVNGSAGCNNYTGGYESGAGTLKVGGLSTTRKLCHKPDGVMVQEAQYLTALSSASTYEIAGDTLTIRDGSGAMQVVAKQAAAASGLAGTAWEVTGFNNGKEAVVSVIIGTEISLNFGKDGTVSGVSGCNNYTGAYESSGDSLKVGPLAGTLRACPTPNGVMEQETQYLAALQNSATYVIDGSTLTIRDTSGAMQVTATKREPVTLAGSLWTVTNYNNGKQAVVSVVQGTEISLDFGTAGSLSGYAGCNNYSGGFEATADTLTVGRLISTQRACIPDAVSTQEAQYLAALQNAATFDITNNVLTIRDASGATQVVASKREPITLAGSAWEVTSYNNGNQGVVSLVIGTEISLKFGTDGRLSGNSSCNIYNGSFEATADTLKVGPLVSTQRACVTPDGVMTQEAQYLAALQNAATYDISTSTLTIRDATSATQVVATKSAPVTLAGSAWTVVNVNNGKEAVVSLVIGTDITLDFGTDGRVSGNAGCNTYTGTYESAETTLKVGALASTLKLCTDPAGVMDQEAQYLAALQNAATYDISGPTLTIRDAGGAMQVVATR